MEAQGAQWADARMPRAEGEGWAGMLAEAGAQAELLLGLGLEAARRAAAARLMASAARLMASAAIARLAASVAHRCSPQIEESPLVHSHHHRLPKPCSSRLPLECNFVCKTKDVDTPSDVSSWDRWVFKETNVVERCVFTYMRLRGVYPSTQDSSLDCYLGPYSNQLRIGIANAKRLVAREQAPEKSML